MIIKNFLIFGGLTISLILNAQQVITTSGGNMSNNTVLVNWTIGELVTETTLNNKNIVTSGFNQPLIKIETSIENIRSKLNVSIYPNPTSQYVNINYEGTLPVVAKIISQNGSILSVYEINENNTQLDFSKFLSGFYIVLIIDKSGVTNTYNIIKQ